MASKITSTRKDFGMFATPQWVVDFMVSLINGRVLSLSKPSILEPACGECQFLLGIKRNIPHLFNNSRLKIGVEINKEAIKHVEGAKIIHGDYLLWNTAERFDLVIGNPPYGIPSLSEHYTIKVGNETKEKYKKIYKTWYGKYNMYGAFIEKSVRLLKERGQLIFIVPATFLILSEFKKLRKFLAANGKTEIIYMGPGIFKPEAEVTTVVLNFVKATSESNRMFLIDYNNGNLKLISRNLKWTGEEILFSSDLTKALDETFSFRLGDVYTIRISPRTPEIRNNPSVIKADSLNNSHEMLPILNSKNLKPGRVIYKPTTGYWIERSKRTLLRKFFNAPHIVVGLGFRNNGGVGAGYDYKAYPWMGDVYHLLRKHTLMNIKFDLSEEEVVSYLNSEIIRRYVKDVFRDITYHFNINQLKILPLPTKDELKKATEFWQDEKLERRFKKVY